MKGSLRGAARLPKAANLPAATAFPVSLVGDAFLASPFRIEWAAPSWSPNERAEIERGVAQRATAILRSARFAAMLHDHQDVEAEVKVWLETSTVPVHVAVWWEESRTKFWFAVVDACARERVALVVFDLVPSVNVAEMEAENGALLDVVRSLVPGTADVPMEVVMEAVHEATLADPPEE